MASTSTSSVQKSFKYDVFISFRGEDTRNTFVGHLYNALEQKGIETYIDDKKIRKGKTISDELIEAIENSRFYIIVFSKKYASSSWCLEELVKIMECQKMPDHTAYPVFYDVEPTEVRKLYGPVGEAFKKHENDESARKWRQALKEAASLAGWELKTTAAGHEANFIHKIIQDISLELRFIDSSVDGNLVGMETRVDEIISSLEVGVDDVRMIGIKGMGGAGKTTLARAVFDKLSFQFEGQSFVENIREKSSLSGLDPLQKQVLSDVLNDQGITVSGVHEGKKMIKKKVCIRKVLIVLDDVDKIEQLEALVGDRDWFKPGSRIIITTREEQVLVAHEVNLIRDVHLLDDKEAICLFSRHAFRREIPIERYKELSKQVVRYAAGLPLTIRVLGSFLHGKDDREWEDAIDRLKTIPLRETIEKLELSYDDLEEDYKDIFLDVACMFKGCWKENAIRALESCGFSARIGLRVLELKSLITISGGIGKLGMHDHIEEMGKNIVRRVNPNKPEMHSRLWIKEETKDVLANNSGTQATQCIQLIADADSDADSDAIIALKSCGFPARIGLRVLEQKSLITISERGKLGMHDHIEEMGKNIVRRENPNKPEMHSRLWIKEEIKDILANDSGTQATPQCIKLDDTRGLDYEILMNGLANMKELRFLNVYAGYVREEEVRKWKFDEDSLHLPNALRFLRWTSYPFSSLPKTFQPNNLVGLEIHFGKMVKLWKDGEEKPFLKLRFLIFTFSRYLRTLDLSVAPNLETLMLGGCDNLVEVDFQVTPNLKELRIEYCGSLEKLHLPAESPKLRSLNLSYLELRTLHLGITPNLETLRVNECTDLVELQIPAECPKLRSLYLDNLKKLRTLHLGVTPNLETLRVTDCPDLVELQIPAECPKLVNLDLSGCIQVAELPEEIGQLECLKELDITGTCIRHLPQSILRVKGLRIVGSRELLESCGFTSEINTSDDETFCYI